MTTTLTLFSDAYATLTVALYQPVILQWYSVNTLGTLANIMAWRAQKSKAVTFESDLPTAQKLGRVPRPEWWLPNEEDLQNIDVADLPKYFKPVDALGHPYLPQDVRPVDLEGFPDAVVIGNTIYPYGVLNVWPQPHTVTQTGNWFTRLFGMTPQASEAQRGDVRIHAKTLPAFVNRRMGYVDNDFNFYQARNQLFESMYAAVNNAIASGEDPEVALADSVGIHEGKIYDFWPDIERAPDDIYRGTLNEDLSPIGVANYLRQYYFNLEEGVGPIEEAFTVAPKETLEVELQTIRRQSHEEILEVGSEEISERAVETKNLDEVSDKVSYMIQRDASVAMSASTSGNIGVWSASASASAELSTAVNRSREQASRHLHEITKRSSERVTKTFRVRTTEFEEEVTTSLTRRVISNEMAYPVSYGLRRIFRKVRIKVQDLGPRLVWQLYIRSPGQGLIRSRFVHFREAEAISEPGIPPGVPPKPKGGTDTGSSSATIENNAAYNSDFVNVAIVPPPGREIVAASIDSISDLEGGGKDDPSAAPLNHLQWGTIWANGKFTTNIAVKKGDSTAVLITYTYSWVPDQQAWDDWQAIKDQAIKAVQEEQLQKKFEQERALITERSKIRARPAEDQRQEERHEIMNRLITHLFSRGDDPAEPTPFEIETFHRYFDLNGMFSYTHPSWWTPRWRGAGTEKETYEITADSEPSPMGSSLGWMIQLDGDTRRNAFLNSPWARICMPIIPGRERQAIKWLAKHVEGRLGYDPAKDPLKQLLIDIAARRTEETHLGVNGPNYVTLESSVGGPSEPPPEPTPESVFPIVHEFEVNVPTDGFIYDELLISNSQPPVDD